MNSEDMTHVDCTKFEEILHDLDRPGSRAIAFRENALAHAESCSHCARLLTESESLDFALQDLAMHSVSHAPPRIEAVLVQAFRKQNAQVLRRRIQWRLIALASAALVLLSLGLSLHQASVPGAASGPTEPDARSSSQGLDRFASQAQTGHLAGDEKQTSDSEYASTFVSLPYADDPATLEGGAVVRVVLSGSALASLGMPVPDLELTDQIPADILLSEDGAPQAVRLVSQLDAQ
jgi:hypothetical protein